MEGERITVFLADDNLIVREGVRALLSTDKNLEVVGVAADYDELVKGAEETAPNVVVTDIRMPPNFAREGIDAAKEIRKRHPGTGIVILSQYDDPDYAVSLLAEDAAGYAYLLKDRVAEGDQLSRAVVEVASGGSMIDPSIVSMLVRPVTKDGELSDQEEALLQLVAEGRPIKAIAAARNTTPAAAADEVDKLFVRIAQQASSGGSALKRLRMLHDAIVDREETGETLSRLLPGGLADKVRREGRRIGETENLRVTVLMSDIRGYTTLAEKADNARLAGQLNAHRAVMNKAIIAAGGTVMQFVGDAVMAVFGAPVAMENHASHAVEAAAAMHQEQSVLNEQWAADGLPPFGLGIGVSTGDVAAALLGSEQRIEYTVVGDAVNLSQRLQQFAEPGETVLSEATMKDLESPPETTALDPQLVKGREAMVQAYKVAATQ
ncbi:MAG TPA: adenylate/guanylate cyclase domain-containing protein [Acidimicrobiales bacterium]|nr:adenylate/guanylate cyclase domain-containing protein [Acidimicrobiales bacterium]